MRPSAALRGNTADGETLFPKNAILNFTFFWPEENRWEGKGYTVAVQANLGRKSKRRGRGKSVVSVE